MCALYRILGHGSGGYRTLGNAEKCMLVQYDDAENILKTSKVFEGFLPAAAEDRQLETHRAASLSGALCRPQDPC